jgi:hypothetical protein
MTIPTHTEEGLTLGPVQMLIVGFEGDKFDGSIMKELDRLREHDIVRLIDLLFVKKNEDGEIEVAQRSDLDAEEAQEFGAIIGALVGLGADGEEGAEYGALAGAAELEDGHVFDDEAVWYLATRSPTELPPRLPCSSTAGRSRCATRSRRPEGSPSRTRGSTLPTSSPSGRSPRPRHDGQVRLHVRRSGSSCAKARRPRRWWP